MWNYPYVLVAWMKKVFGIILIILTHLLTKFSNGINMKTAAYLTPVMQMSLKWNLEI